MYQALSELGVAAAAAEDTRPATTAIAQARSLTGISLRAPRPPPELARRLAQLPGEIGALLRGRAEQSSTTHRAGPRPVSLAERRFERVAKLLAAERLGLEERELPAVEGIAEPRVVVRRAQP